MRWQIILLLALVACTPSAQLLSNEELSEFGLSGSCKENFCNYTSEEGNIYVIVSEFDDPADLNGSYQYQSLHLRGYNGLISEDEYGDYSRLYFTNDSDLYYNLWIQKYPYLVEVTSKGVQDQSKIEEIGQSVLGRLR